MTDERSNAPAGVYLRQLARGLRPLSQAERYSIVAEIEAHIAERLSAGAEVETILSGLGSADDLARAYVEEDTLSRALAQPSPGPLLAALLSRATQSLSTFAAGLAALILYALSASLACIGLLKPIAPANVGYWSTPSGPEVGFLAAPPAETHEILGFLIVPLSLVLALVCYLAATALIKMGARRLLRSSRAPRAS